MVLPFRRLAAVTVTAEVHHDDGESLGKLRRDLVPLDVRLRIAVDEQQGRTAAAAQRVDRSAGGLNLTRFESREERP